MRVLIVLAIGFACRLLLNYFEANTWLESRFELSSPLTSWKRAREAVFLTRNGLPIYEGDISHYPPLLVRMFSVLMGIFGERIDFAFMLTDMVTAFVLYLAAMNFSKAQARAQIAVLSRHQVMSPTDFEELQLTPLTQVMKPLGVVSWTMFNPFLILACVAKSTATFDNLFLACFLLFYSKPARMAASFFLAVSAYTSVYPIGLLPALCLQMWKADKEHLEKAAGGNKKFTTLDVVTSCFKTVASFMVCMAMLLQLSYGLDSNGNFISAVYGFILSAPDASPNLGLFWYLFAEMFDHFHHFFLVVFQLNPFIYILPLTIRLSDDPIFLVHQLIGVFAIFKSYPTLADIGFFICLIPLWSHLTKYMRNVFIVTCMFAAVCILAPVLFQLWIFAGAANANFYFGATLAFSTAEIFLVTDLLYARLRAEFHLEVGEAKPQIPMTDRQALLMLS